MKPRARSQVHRVMAALGSLVLAIALVAGVPVALWRLAGWPLPETLPSLDDITTALSRNSVSDAVVIKTIALIAWAAWLLLCWSLTVETWAWARGLPSPRLRFAGPFQDLARYLVMSVSLLAATGMARTGPDPALVGFSVPIEEVAPAPPVTPVPARQTSSSPIVSEPVVAPTYTVQRRDNLWNIAECHLGDPLRWREIWSMNRGRDFGGVTFTRPDLIYPGWVLLLPASGPEGAAPVTGPSPAPSTTAVPAPPTPTTAPPTPTPAPAPAPPTTSPSTTAHSTTTTTLESTATTIESSTAVPSGAVAEKAEETDGLADRSQDAADGGEQDDVWKPILAGGVALATALVLLLTRLRRSQSRRRAPGSTPHPPAQQTSSMETVLRRSADPTAMDRLFNALRAFASGFRGHAMPEISAVRLASDEVEVLLSSTADTVPAGFTDSGERRAFATEAGLSDATLQGLAVDTAACWLALVAAGSVGGDPVLIDLETTGAVTVDGPGAQDTVRRMITELAATPVSDLVEILVVGDEFDLATSDRITSVATVEDAITRLDLAVRNTRTALDRLGDADTPTARLLHSADHGWGVTVFASLNPLSDDQRAKLADVVDPGTGVAAVLVGVPEPGTCSLNAHDTVRLEPHGFDLEPLPLSADELAAIDSLLADAAVGDAEEKLLPAEEAEVASVYLPAGPAAGPPTGASGAEFDVQVLVLGPVEIVGAGAINRRRAVEVVVFLALHRGGVTNDQIRAAVWPETIPAQDTFNTTVSRARGALGTDRDDEYNLPHAVTNDGRYLLGPYVGTDLAQFTELVRRARITEDVDEERSLLREAVGLLRGQPFEGMRGYEWAYTEGIIAETEAMIADAAHRLAQLALEDNDAELATWAALSGLKAVPGSEPLYRDRMEAAHLNGDPAAVDRIIEELCRYVETLDPLDDLHPETIDLWRRIGRPPGSTNGQSDQPS